MIAHIIVLDNPYFALTDEKGVFVLSGVPDGEYTLRTWHVFGQEVRKQVEVESSSLSEYVLEIQENKNFIQHKNKFGKLYKGKYN